MAETLDQVKTVVANLLKIDVAKITAESKFVDDLGADSMKSVELVAAFEDAFDIEMNEEDALKVRTVGDASAFIDKIIAETE